MACSPLGQNNTSKHSDIQGVYIKKGYLNFGVLQRINNSFIVEKELGEPSL